MNIFAIVETEGRFFIKRRYGNPARYARIEVNKGRKGKRWL